MHGVHQSNAVYKLSIFLILFNQAFRFAAEPYFFKNAQEDLRQLALATRLFAALLAFGVVAVLAGLPWLKYFIADKYWNDLLLLPVPHQMLEALKTFSQVLLDLTQATSQ